MALRPAMSDAMGASAAQRRSAASEAADFHGPPLSSASSSEKTEMPLEGGRRLSVPGAALDNVSETSPKRPTRTLALV